MYLIEMMQMPDKIFIDTNIVIYSLGEHSTKAHKAAPLFVDRPSISTQVLSETANVTTKRLGLAMPEVRKLIKTLHEICHIELITMATIEAALNVHERYKFSWYDSLIIATALEAGCTTLYSEDMQNDQVIEGRLKIVNPFC